MLLRMCAEASTVTCCRACYCRCNFDVQQRAHWLQIADEVCGGRDGYLSMTLRLATSMAECRQRAFARTDHPTLNGYAAALVIDR